MNKITVKKHRDDADELVGVYASEDDADVLVNKDTLIYNEDGDLVCAYLERMPGDCFELKEALNATKIRESARATKRSPMKTQSETFGYLPALHTRNHPCRLSSICRTNTRTHEALMGMTRQVANIYKQLAPDIASRHEKLTMTKMLDEYRIHQTMFTSGIVNKSTQLPYHYDAGNFKGAWSAMLGLSEGITGGNLALPEFNLKMAITDQSLCFFDGQKRVHGVTPIFRNEPDAERYTIVWYSLEKLWKCLTKKEEIKKMNLSQTKKNRSKRDSL